MDNLPESGHLVIVQDDVVPAPNFAEALGHIAAANPDIPVCLFLARLPREASVKAGHAMKQRRRYIDLSWRSFLPVVAVLWPVHKALEFRDWADTNPRFPGVGGGQPRSDDAMGGRWKMVTRQTVRATVPSIVQHPDEEPSLIGRRAMWGKDAGRVAFLLAEDAMDYDWSVV
ncbi:MAG TPA: hypothetical protein VNN79_02820 [Actinomycetota bacterium]|nr:hypothetical protein [Actinomycetota bacterium]